MASSDVGWDGVISLCSSGAETLPSVVFSTPDTSSCCLPGMVWVAGTHSLLEVDWV